MNPLLPISLFVLGIADLAVVNFVLAPHYQESKVGSAVAAHHDAIVRDAAPLPSPPPSNAMDATSEEVKVVTSPEPDSAAVPVEPTLPFMTRVEFTNASNQISQEARGMLEDLAVIAHERPTLDLEITGYTDQRGDPQANLQLSRRRARAVVQFLVSKGIRADRIKAKGLGEANPIVELSNHGQAENRRVEIVWHR